MSQAQTSRGVRAALLPIASLVVILGLTAVSAVAVRDLTFPPDFVAHRRLVMTVVTIGLLSGFIVYGLFCAVAFRRLQRLDQLRASGPALWILWTGGIVTALPVAAAVLWRQ